jgi:glycosyltransferase involved in cell wall biosynthesis
MTVAEEFTEIMPSPREIGAGLVRVQRRQPFDVYVVPEADHFMKVWWRIAPRELRSVRGIAVYARFPSRVSLLFPKDVAHRVAKTGLALLGRASGRLDRVVCLTGRDDIKPGWLVKRARDPAICTAHSRDRAALRAQLGLPQERSLVGILGLISTRKSAPMVFDAVLQAGAEIDLLLAGELEPDLEGWFAGLTEAERARIHARLGFLAEEELDAYVAASDVTVFAHLNRGPSGIMGKAQVAGVATLTAGSPIRRREALAFGGVDAEMTAAGLADGIRELLARGGRTPEPQVALPTAEEFGARVLGVPVPPHAAEVTGSRYLQTRT